MKKLIVTAIAAAMLTLVGCAPAAEEAPKVEGPTPEQNASIGAPVGADAAPTGGGAPAAQPSSGGDMGVSAGKGAKPNYSDSK